MNPLNLRLVSWDFRRDIVTVHNVLSLRFVIFDKTTFLLWDFQCTSVSLYCYYFVFTVCDLINRPVIPLHYSSAWCSNYALPCFFCFRLFFNVTSIGLPSPTHPSPPPRPPTPTPFLKYYATDPCLLTDGRCLGYNPQWQQRQYCLWCQCKDPTSCLAALTHRV